jgi:ABC-type thiamine transport system ATPase subunit
MGLEDKVQYADGGFTTTRLSTGQRKRLALIVALLEDRPLLVLDEFAADQDPPSRQRFYEELLAAAAAARQDHRRRDPRRPLFPSRRPSASNGRRALDRLIG